MENIHPDYLQQAIQDVRGLLEQVDSIISLHRAQPSPDTLAIQGYERQRVQFLEQLAELSAQRDSPQ